MQTQFWKRTKAFNQSLRKDSFKIYERLLLQLCSDHSGFGSSQTVLACVMAKDWRGLLDLADSLSGQMYTTATEHFVANQFAALIKKFPWTPSQVKLDPEGTAVAKFLKSEHSCKRTNQRFRAFARRSPHESHLQRMRGYISHVLGDSPNLSKILDGCGFGPGASIGVHGNATNVARKLLARWSVSPATFGYVALAVARHEQVREMLLLRSSRTRYTADTLDLHRSLVEKCDVVNHNKIVFVPKTAKTARSIAIEPLMNGFIQKGVDLYMRNLLKRVNVNLEDQSWNRELARRGSLDDSDDGAVTIDLSSASDSMATEMVRYLLPPEWFELLNALRCKSGQLAGVLLPYQKFCSMGNGFCFPLESLIFAAAVNTAGGKLGVDSSVYGDDIIVPKRLSSDLLGLLKVLGFSVNSDKTFLSGPFRESCGADWYGGKDVRPFTLDFDLDCIQSIFKILNLTKRNDMTTSFFSALDLSWFKVPEFLRLMRPYKGQSDTAVTVSLDTFMSSSHARWVKTLYAWSWRELIATPVADRVIMMDKAYSYALVFGALSGVTSTDPFTLRRETHTKLRRVTGSGAYSNWLPASSLASVDYR